MKITVPFFLGFILLTNVALCQVPTISSFSPASGPVGTTVTISGTNFSTTPANNIVYFGTGRATVNTSTSTQLSVTVPAGASAQSISVLVGGLVAYSTKPFVVAFNGAASNFATKIDLNTPGGANSVSIGDLDGDGKADLATANYFGSLLSVFRNTSTVGVPSFVAQPTTSFPFANASFIGDVDGDGKPDLLATSASPVVVSIYRNTSTVGTISFAAKVDVGTSQTPNGISMAEIDGDGKPDLIVSVGNAVAVFRNTSTPGTVSFGPLLGFSVGAGTSGTFFSTVGDFDGDGKMDIAVANGNNSVGVLRNTSTVGSITFAPFVKLDAGAQPTSVAAGDFDGDGKPDLAVSNSGTNTVSLFRNTSSVGTVSFDLKQDITTGSGAYSVASGDINGDGLIDLAAVNNGSNTVSVFTNTSTVGSISFTAKVDFGCNVGPKSVAMADLDGDGKMELFCGAAAGSVHRNITKFKQTITFNSLPTKTFGDAPFTITATASSSLPVSFTSGNIFVASVSGNTVTIAGAGTGGSIIATQAGDANYAPATAVTQPLTVNKASQSITFSALPSKTFGDPAFNLSATSTSGLAVSYTSSNTSVATVSGNTVTIVGAGTTNITASQAGNGNYNAAPDVPQSLTVNKANQTISFNPLVSKTFGDASFNLTATSSSSLAISFATSNPAVATVAGNTVTIVGAGTTTITASQSGNANYNPATNAQQSFTVNKANQTITFAPLPARIIGDVFQLTAAATSSLPVSYTSSNLSVATISGQTVTVLGSGTTTITASQSGDGNYNPATNASQALFVKQNQIITFNALPDKQFGNAPFSLTASVSSSLPLTFTSSNPSVASVSGNTVTILSVGTTTLTATQEGDPNYAPASASQPLTINKASQTISFAALPAQTYGDAPVVLSATSSSALVIGYTSSNTAVATVSGNTLTMVGAGTTIITASQPGDASYDAATDVQQTLVVNKASQTITFAALSSVSVGNVFQLTATSSSALPVSFTSSDASIATVAGTTVTVLAAGTTTLVASQSGNDNYEQAPPVSQTLLVKQGQTITFAPLPDKTVGDSPFTISATASSGQPVTFTSSSSKISLSGSQVTLLAAGRATITAQQGGDANFDAAPPVANSFCIKPTKPVVAFSNANTPAPTLTSSAASGNQWFLNGAPISGATNSTLSVSQAGVYKLQVRADDCASAFSDDVPVIVTAVEPSQSGVVQLYPNPAIDELILNLQGFDAKRPVNISITDLQGRQAKAVSANGGEQVRIDIRGMNSGQYLAVMEQGGKRIARLFVKKF